MIDFAVGTAAPVVVYFLYKTGRVEKSIWYLFWLGFTIGLTWEVPLMVLNEYVDGVNLYYFIRPMPAHFVWTIIMHSSWDGMLFLLGVIAIRLVCGGPVLERARPGELAVFILWGQASELWVELTSTYGEAWVYIVQPWNPLLFKFNGQDITLLPQLIWLYAPVVYYFIAIPLKRKDRF